MLRTLREWRCTPHALNDKLAYTCAQDCTGAAGQQLEGTAQCMLTLLHTGVQQGRVYMHKRAKALEEPRKLR